MSKQKQSPPAKTGALKTGAAKKTALKKPLLSLSLQFADTRHKNLLPRHKVAKWLRLALDAQQVETAQINVRIVDASQGQDLNRQYRHKNYATNVLTFDYTHGPALEADLVICAPVVEQEALQHNKNLQAHYAHLLIHGALHAQGWDHESDSEAQQMEQREAGILAALGFDNPYA